MLFPGYFTKADLKRRGIPDRLIDGFFPEPHRRVDNPLNVNWAPVCLYDRKVVEEVEADPGFQARKRCANKFQAHMKVCMRKARERRAEQSAYSS